MHPAFSVIFFTVMSGMGYGLAFFLGLALVDPDTLAGKAAHVTALVMIALGLVSSTFHLGNPQRAWRAFSQWRSSWLSREGVMAIVTFVPLTLNAALAVFFGTQNVWLGLAGSVCAVATVYCTAMIYASLRTVDAWHTWKTPACYIAFAFAGGALWTLVFTLLSGRGEPFLPGLLALLGIAVAWACKANWLASMRAHVSASTPETATGLGHLGAVRLLERPHATENYLTREMGFKIARKHAEKLRGISVLLSFVVPALCVALAFPGLLIQGASPWLALLAGAAVLSHAAGMFVERWLFFAEARHAITNYYEA
ncbi:dimethyl sulfoxide reductase anchor subunit family protein [Oricola sp.]|uniref:dimethyl sulfoxide reductase anchor subunit family protein n=1 Tax=Oricola sp. TaxID=1979950 RepID=UPI003BABCE6B